MYSTEHPRLVIILWLSVIFILAGLSLHLGALTSIPGPTSHFTLEDNQGERLVRESIPPRDRLVMILSHKGLDSSSPQVVAARDAAVMLLKSKQILGTDKALFDRIETVGRNLKGDSYFTGKDVLLIVAEASLPVDQSVDDFEQLPQEIEEWNKKHAPLRLYFASDGTLKSEMFDLIHRDLDRSLLITIPLTLVILLHAFRSVMAALLILGIALGSLVASLAAAAILSHVLGPISATASQLVVLLVLAIGVDYGLFFLTRFREELRTASDLQRVLVHCKRTTGVAIWWSGLTVAVSLIGLLLMGDSVLSSMAVVSIVAVIITLIGSLWVLPAVLALCGKRLAVTRDEAAIERWVVSGLRIVLRYPARTVGLCLVALSLLGAMSLGLKLGTTIEPEILPKSMQIGQAHEILKNEFSEFDGVDFTVILNRDRSETLEDEVAIDSFIDALHKTGLVRGPQSVEVAADEKARRMQFTAIGSANDEPLQQLIHHIREELAPQLMLEHGIQTFLSGTLPYVVDEIERHRSRLPLVIGVVLALSMVFLLIAFRSIVIPLKALALNLLSCIAAFGALVLAFQGQFIASWNYGVVECFVPALLFSILFGLSMDYHVFLLSRISEEYRGGKSLTEAVERGILETWRPITSAALIMVSVFAVIASLQLPVMRQLGFGLTVAVFIDATIIRSMLLPASMLLLGRWNWYLPRWLEWLPKMRVH